MNGELEELKLKTLTHALNNTLQGIVVYISLCHVGHGIR